MYGRSTWGMSTLPSALRLFSQEGYQHPRRGHAGVVERVRQVELAVRAADAYLQPAGLGVAQVGAGADLEVLLLPGAPGLDVAALHLQVRQVAGAAVQLAHGDVQTAEELHAVAPELLIPVHALLGAADHYHLLLLKLVYAVDAALLYAVGALLLAEAGGVAGEGHRQLLLGQNLVYEAPNHAVFAGPNQIEVLALYLVHHAVHLGEGHHALHHRAVYHEGGDDIGEALVYHEVARIGQHGLVQAGYIAQQVVEAVARHAPGGVQVYAAEALHNLRVVGNGKI